jgi:FMN-dependent NADH-azoreductase
MKNLLQLNASIFSANGHSSQLANSFVTSWQTNHPDTQVTVRDLANEPLPHLDMQRVLAFSTAPELRTPEQQAFVDVSDKLITEIRQADIIVMGLPMYNFGIPSTLKAYFDYIARAGVTFRYTESGSIGLLTGKKVIVFATRGGLYAGTRLDTQTSYVRNYFNFLGISDVEFIYAEGLNKGEPSKEIALTKANLRLVELAA